MPKLFFAPKACSLAPHILLEESGLPYERELVDIFENAHLQPAYLRINPRARVPALQLDSGEILTEVMALLTWISDQVPERGFIPAGALERARCMELMSFIGTRVHPSFAQVVRPDRFSSEASDHARITQHGVRAYLDNLKALDAMLKASPYAMGKTFTAVDAYALVFVRSAELIGLDVSDLSRLRACADATLARPAVRRVLAAEGFEEFRDSAEEESVATAG